MRLIKKRSNATPKEPTTFGRHIQEHCDAFGIKVPMVVRMCVQFIEDSLSESGSWEGVYRVPGSLPVVDQLMCEFPVYSSQFQQFDSGKRVNLQCRGVQEDPNVVASLLKKYFRTLPEPLLSPQVAAKLSTALCKGIKLRMEHATVKEILTQLAPTNYSTLAYIIDHLHKVVKSEKKTSMNLQSMAVCWTPTLFWVDPKDLSPKQCAFTMAAEMKFVIEYLIVNSSKLFSPVEIALSLHFSLPVEAPPIEEKRKSVFIRIGRAIIGKRKVSHADISTLHNESGVLVDPPKKRDRDGFEEPIVLESTNNTVDIVENVEKECAKENVTVEEEPATFKRSASSRSSFRTLLHEKSMEMRTSLRSVASFAKTCSRFARRKSADNSSKASPNKCVVVQITRDLDMADGSERVWRETLFSFDVILNGSVTPVTNLDSITV